MAFQLLFRLTGIIVEIFWPEFSRLSSALLLSEKTHPPMDKASRLLPAALNKVTDEHLSLFQSCKKEELKFQVNYAVSS